MDFRSLFEKNKVVVAPMAGITNAAFREILQVYEPALIYSEMVSDKAINYRNDKTLEMLRVNPGENSVVLQLFGGEAETIAPATQYVSQHTNAVMIDLNAGCPVSKVVKAGSGSSLMEKPQTLADMIHSMRDRSDVPISVKIRSGYDSKKNAPQIARIAEDAGASLITVHGRTRSQMYKGKVDLDIIKAVKEAVNIPVIGNGDITSPEEAKAMIDYTGVDAVMVGRALRTSPWLIKQINDYLLTGTYTGSATNDARLDTVLEHARKLIALKGEAIAMLEMRTHAPAYLKGMPGATVIKRELVGIETFDAFQHIIESYRSDLQRSK